MLFAEGLADEHPMLAGLGIEPTGNALDGALLASLLKGRRSPLKAALLDQTLIAGLGNIYVSEALWRAGLSPLRAAGTIAGTGKKAKEPSGATGRGNPLGHRRCDRGRRLVAARLCPHRRVARLFPAFLLGLRSRGRALPDAWLRRPHRAHRAERPLDLLLPGSASGELGRSSNAGTRRPAHGYETIIVETRGKVGLITLNRPKALNALNAQVLADYWRRLKAFEADPGIGAIVITGSEKAFAAGADIKEMQTQDLRRRLSRGSSSPAGSEFARIRKPIIAAVAGYALGGGCELAMMCDFIIAADTAKFGQPEITLGVMPGMGGSQRLTRFVGKSKAMDMCLTGRMMDAAEAERSGLVVACRAGRRTDRRGDEGRGEDRRVVAARRDDGQGGRQPRLRDHAGRGRALRAPAVPLAVRDSKTRRKAWRPLSRSAQPNFTQPLALGGRAKKTPKRR